MRFTELPDAVLEKLAVNAGVILSTFDPKSGAITKSNIIGATTGGVTVTCVPSYTDMGEDIDNCPKNTKELKNLASWECKMSGTLLTVDTATCKRLLGAADIDVVDTTKVTPRSELKQADFEDLWYVCDYGDTDGGFVAVKIMNALSSGGFSLKSTDKSKGQFAFEFIGHSSTEDVSTIPMEVYVNAGSAS